MKLIIGVGNPGEEHKNNRHNVGFMFIDELKKLGTKELKNIKIVKSDKFMNDSGIFVKNLSALYNLQSTDLYIVHDDLDIKLGEYKIQFGKGPKDHNGILSIEEALGTKDFWRVRIGVDNRPIENRTQGIEYVLLDFSEDELVILNTVFKEIYKELSKILN